ncbi:MAG: phage terminase large subunit [Termitinemataceae bacterium]|nr:MAG: phage terminase large subunit [Termitinemataceae bacterium]
MPAHFLGLFPDCKVLLAGHTDELTTGFSKQSRDLIKEIPYQELFPGVNIKKDDGGGAHWKVEGRQGECYSSGLLGSMTGQGGDLLILDDYLRNRADAESATIREKTWDAFTNNFMTRRAPISITIVLATRWHTDDIIGRIIEHMKTDPAFPKFKIINIPAFSETYPTGTLFPERFSKEWYEQQRATLGPYGTSSLMQNDPVPRGGNMLSTECLQKHKSISEYPKNLLWYRVWDLAHTAKERMKQDPDYTSGTLLAFQEADGMLHLWIKDVQRMRKAAPERDLAINNIAKLDGAYVRIGVEDTVDSKDAYSAMCKILKGKRTILSAKGEGDKVVRATPLEPIFKAGNVHVPADAPWLHDWIAELSAFPSGTHDDQVDNLSAGYVLYDKSDARALYEW